MQEAGEAKRMEFLQREAERDARVKPTLAKFITNKDRVALVQCIIASKDLSITKHGNMLDLFLSGLAVQNRTCGKALLRMLFLLPPDLQCVKVLRDSLLNFAQLSPETDNLRNLEWVWVKKLLNAIAKLSRTSGLVSQNLTYNLTLLSRSLPGKEYCLGNAMINQEINTMQACNLARDASLTGGEQNASMKDFLARLNARSLATLRDPEQMESEQAEGEQMESGQVENEVMEPEVILTEPGNGEQTLNFDEDKVLVIDGKEIILKKNTPVKVKQLGRSLQTNWSDRMKLQLLELYVLHAPDPLLRDLGVWSMVGLRE